MFCTVLSIMLSPGAPQALSVYSCEDPSTAATEFSLHVGLTIFGAFLGAILADKFGRKKALFGTIIFVVPRVLLAVFNELPGNTILRGFVKIGFGMTSTLVPLYTAEIADTKNRRRLMTLQIPLIHSSYIIPTLIGSTSVVLNVISLVMYTLIYFIILVFFPETPHYLYSKKNYSEAAKSLAFFKGLNNVKIHEEAIELLSPDVQANINRDRFIGKIREMFQFANRRSLAIIVSLIGIRWATGRCRNWVVFMNSAFTLFKYGTFNVFSGISIALLIFKIIVTVGIDIFSRKLFLLLLLFVDLIVTIIGMMSFMQYHWVLFGVFLIQNLSYLIIYGVTLAYMGEFFPTSIRALAIATLMSCEFLISSIFLMTEQCLLSRYMNLEYATLLSYPNGVVYFYSILLVAIFFPKINKMPCSQITIDKPGYLGCVYTEHNAN